MVLMYMSGCFFLKKKNNNKRPHFPFLSTFCRAFLFSTPKQEVGMKVVTRFTHIVQFPHTTLRISQQNTPFQLKWSYSKSGLLEGGLHLSFLFIFVPTLCGLLTAAMWVWAQMADLSTTMYKVVL